MRKTHASQPRLSSQRGSPGSPTSGPPGTGRGRTQMMTYPKATSCRRCRDGGSALRADSNAASTAPPDAARSTATQDHPSAQIALITGFEPHWTGPLNTPATAGRAPTAPTRGSPTPAVFPADALTLPVPTACWTYVPRACRRTSWHASMETRPLTSLSWKPLGRLQAPGRRSLGKRDTKATGTCLHGLVVYPRPACQMGPRGHQGSRGLACPRNRRRINRCGERALSFSAHTRLSRRTTSSTSPCAGPTP